MAAPAPPPPPPTTSVTLAHLCPAPTVHIHLFAGVRNAAHLRAQLLASNPDYDYALIDASLVLSTAHLLAACSRACGDARAGRLRSRNVHSEIVLCLSGASNIAAALRTFGVRGDSASVVAVKVSAPAPGEAAEAPGHVEERARQCAAFLARSVDGDPAPFDDASLARITDVGAVRKAYKCPETNFVRSEGGVGRMDELTVVALGMMALRGS